MTQTFEDASGGIESKAVAARRTQIMMCPFTNNTNRYIEIQKDLFRAIGYDVVPLSMKGLLQGGFIQLFNPNNILVFHWLELRPFKRKNGRTHLTIPGCLIFAFYCSLMSIGRAKVVYFQHDHAVHDTTGFIRRLSIRLIRFVRSLVDFRVVHAPDCQARYDAEYLPHPLYWDVPGQASTTSKNDTGAPLFSLLGAIRPYKQISAVLDVWPAECNLYIAGLGSESYIATLNGIISQRSLRDAVRLDAKFLSDAEFAQGIANSDVLILPHAADSMLVSGAFFEAIGRVPLVIARSTPFMIWAANKFDNVLLFNSIDELPEIVRSVQQSWPDITRKLGNGLATDEFGWASCCRHYAQFFETVVGRGETVEKPAAK